MDGSNNLGFLQVLIFIDTINTRIVTGLGCFKQTKKVDRYILGSNHEFKCEEIVNGAMNQSYEIIAQQ